MSRDENVREQNIECAFVRKVRGLHRQYPHWVKKVPAAASGWRSWPDRTVMYWATGGSGPCTHWVEFKRPKGGRFEPLQLRTYRMLRKAGFGVFLLNTHAHVEEYVQLIRRHGPTAAASFCATIGFQPKVEKEATQHDEPQRNQHRSASARACAPQRTRGDARTMARCR